MRILVTYTATTTTEGNATERKNMVSTTRETNEPKGENTKRGVTVIWNPYTRKVANATKLANTIRRAISFPSKLI